jgi:phosphopantetheinyl transferase
MPIISEITNYSAENLYLWRISEPTEYLMQLYAAQGVQPPPIQNPLRLRHFLASRLLVRQIFPGSELKKDDFGKPFIEEFNGHISLSHSGELAGLYVSMNGSCGLDIELVGKQINNIAQRFCNSEELEFVQEENVEMGLHLIWGAKECMYKSYGKKGVDFRKQMRISPFVVGESGILQGSINMPDLEAAFHIHYRKQGAYILLWTELPSG